MRINVKKWYFENEQCKAQRYNFTLCWEKLYIDDKNNLIPELWGNNLYNMGKVEFKGYVFFGEKIRETEKAVFFNLKYWNLNKAGRDITHAPIEKTWKAWIPKSAILI